MLEFHLRIRAEKIGFLRFLLEGYDGLATLSTVDTDKGLVKIMVPQARARELMGLLQAVGNDLK